MSTFVLVILSLYAGASTQIAVVPFDSYRLCDQAAAKLNDQRKFGNPIVAYCFRRSE